MFNIVKRVESPCCLFIMCEVTWIRPKKMVDNSKCKHSVLYHFRQCVKHILFSSRLSYGLPQQKLQNSHTTHAKVVTWYDRNSFSYKNKPALLRTAPSIQMQTASAMAPSAARMMGTMHCDQDRPIWETGWDPRGLLWSKWRQNTDTVPPSEQITPNVAQTGASAAPQHCPMHGIQISGGRLQPLRTGTWPVHHLVSYGRKFSTHKTTFAVGPISQYGRSRRERSLCTQRSHRASCAEHQSRPSEEQRSLNGAFCGRICWKFHPRYRRTSRCRSVWLRNRRRLGCGLALSMKYKSLAVVCSRCALGRDLYTTW